MTAGTDELARDGRAPLDALTLSGHTRERDRDRTRALEGFPCLPDPARPSGTT
ncbi:hypothetical protein ABID76_006102 [Burkholderia ambifaria]